MEEQQLRRRQCFFFFFFSFFLRFLRFLVGSGPPGAGAAGLGRRRGRDEQSQRQRADEQRRQKGAGFGLEVDSQITPARAAGSAAGERFQDRLTAIASSRPSTVVVVAESAAKATEVARTSPAR